VRSASNYIAVYGTDLITVFGANIPIAVYGADRITVCAEYNSNTAEIRIRGGGARLSIAIP
jgi:hypothetical protein